MSSIMNIKNTNQSKDKTHTTSTSSQKLGIHCCAYLLCLANTFYPAILQYSQMIGNPMIVKYWQLCDSKIKIMQLKSDSNIAYNFCRHLSSTMSNQSLNNCRHFKSLNAYQLLANDTFSGQYIDIETRFKWYLNTTGDHMSYLTNMKMNESLIYLKIRVQKMVYIHVRIYCKNEKQLVLDGILFDKTENDPFIVF